MTMQVVWHGTQQESFGLVNAIARNCTCEFGLMGVRLGTCAPHRMLTEDQRALNGLLFARRMVKRLRREEWGLRSNPLSLTIKDILEIQPTLEVTEGMKRMQKESER